ncbi:E3 ubiquitin-protein ligase MARCHF2 isoform X1 [Anser cygnoides]|uniref:E3 ubiquitin-protein ligase MARCHF2 isoform X1 n=1 Tax=Anser cygnoides TaxID=8845 RepID=UPI0034D17B27
MRGLGRQLPCGLCRAAFLGADLQGCPVLGQQRALRRPKPQLRLSLLCAGRDSGSTAPRGGRGPAGCVVLVLCLPSLERLSSLARQRYERQQEPLGHSPWWASSGHVTGPRGRGARSCDDDGRLLPPPRLPLRLPGQRRPLQVGGGLRHRAPAVRHAGHRQGWPPPLHRDQGAGRAEWLKDPGPRNEKRTLFCDMVCFLFITPLAAISGWLCLRGAQDHLQFNSRLEAIGLIALTIALFTIYVLWTLVSFRYHCQLYSEWRRTNQKVRLMIPASRSPHPVPHSLLSAKLLKKTADETTV